MDIGGTPLWKNENYSIYDCYAISLDEEENLWFYYYDEFRLVRTNFKEDFVFELPIEGSGAFLLPRPAIPSCFKADTSNGINSTSLPLMVITLGKTGGYSHL